MISQPTVVAANGIELCHQTFGDPADPPLLLVMGLGAQMILWPEDHAHGPGCAQFRPYLLWPDPAGQIAC